MLRILKSVALLSMMLTGPLAVSAATWSLYKVEKKAAGEGEDASVVYQITDNQQLEMGGGSIISSSRSVNLEKDTYWVLSSDYPVLYPLKADGTYDYTVQPEVKTLSAGDIDVYTADDRNAGATAVLYQVSEAAKGTMLFEIIDEENARYSLADPVYLKFLDYNAVNVLSHYSTSKTLEMYTRDGVTYRLDRVELPKEQCFNISTANDFSGNADYVKVNPGVSVELPAAKVAEVQTQMIGAVTATRNGDTYATTLVPADPTPIFIAITNNGSVAKAESYIELTANDDRSSYDYEYVAEVPAIPGGSSPDKAIVITYTLPTEGLTLCNSSTSSAITRDVMAVENKDDVTGTEQTFVYSKNGGKRYTFTDGNFHGRIYLSPKRGTDGAAIADTWVGMVVMSRSAEEIMTEFAGNDDLLDKEVNGTMPLKYASKPILHDNAARKDLTSIGVPNAGNDGVTPHDLIYMERRRALTGVDCNINRVAAGSLATVAGGQTSLGNMMSSELHSPAEFIGVANVKLATAPLVSVRDEKHYYARGTEAGFNLVSGSGTNVLSLSVIETLSIAFYRDGELMTIVPAASKSGSGVDLSLISVGSGEGSYDIKAVSPVVFDEVCLYNSGGLKLEVGNALKVNYAFVGKEDNSEITLGNNGRAAYNARMQAEGKDCRLYVLSHSTPAHISGGVVDGDATSLKDGNFVGDESESENLTNLLSLGTLGMGWAEVKLDAVGDDAPADHEQLFPKGSRVSFRIKSAKVANLGIGTGNTISFFTRKNVERNADGSIKDIDWDSQKVVLSATVLQLGVVSVNGDQLVSMIAPCDFSGVRLDINDGLVNLGGTNVYYASVTPQPYVSHKCELGIPSKIFLTRTQVNYVGPDGEVLPEFTRYEDVTDYTPTWDTSVAADLEWSFGRDTDGNLLIPEGSAVELNENTGRLSGIDKQGEYVVWYQVPGHDSCLDKVTYVVDRSVTGVAADDEIRSIIGNGIVLQNEAGEAEKYALSFDTHGTTSGELLEIAKALQNPQNVLDGKLSTFATAPKGISLAQNSLLLGVRALNGATFGTDDGTGHLKKPLRIGFIVMENADILGVKALDFLKIFAYDTQGEASPVYDALIEENTTVGADLIGEKQVVKKRYSILVPAGKQLFSEFSIWNCGVANIALNDMRIYGTFVEEVDPENVNYNWAVGDRHDLIWKDATAVPMNVGTVEVASVLKNLDFLVDDDLNTPFELGQGLGVGKGQIIRVELGRTVSTNEKIGIIMGNELSTVNLAAGNWMRVRLYGPEKTSRAGGLSKVASSNTAHTEVNEWGVLGAEVAGYGDRKGLYLVPKAPTAALELEFGDIATTAANSSIYGITVAPREDANVRYDDVTFTSVDKVEVPVACGIKVDASGRAVVTAPYDIKDVRLYAIDGKMLPSEAAIDGNSARLDLCVGINIVSMTLTDRTVVVLKAVR